MNRNQKTVIFIALVLFLCCGIFVPYDGTEITKTAIYAPANYTDNRAWSERPMPSVAGYNTEKTNLFIGYFPIFNPPSKRDIIKSFYKKNNLEREYEARSKNDGWTFSTFTSKEQYLELRTNEILNSGSSSPTYESNINILRLIIQIFVLLILTIGLVFVVADSKHKRGEPK